MLPLLSHCLHDFDEICAWSLNFIYRCLSHDYDLIRFISGYYVKCDRSRSCISRNIMFCMQKYNCNVEKVCCGLMNDVIKLSVITFTDSQHVAIVQPNNPPKSSPKERGFIPARMPAFECEEICNHFISLCHNVRIWEIIRQNFNLENLLCIAFGVKLK